MKQLGIIILTSLLSALLAVILYRQFAEPHLVVNEVPSARYTNFSENATYESPQRVFFSAAPTDFTSAAEAVTPAVVNIKSLQTNDGDFWWGGSSFGTSSGSGVLISSDGYVVTNNHVVEDGDDIEVTLNDQRDYEASVIGIDPSTDLALLKLKGADLSGLPYLQFGNSDSLRVGEWVLAVGNPFNLESTVTAGIVSAKGRSIDILDDDYRIESFIQTDAAVNPGNSGGALVNTNGELIGINTAIITKTGRYEGYSFAVPANLARKVIRDLRDFGEVQRAILGVGVDKVTAKLARDLDLPAISGVYITRVTPESGAAEAGIRRGDVIVSINGTETPTVPGLQEKIGSYRPGDRIQVEYFRDGELSETVILLKNKSNSVAYTRREESDELFRELGFDLRDLTQEERNRLGVEGVKVTSIYRDTKIERTNMDPGFIITKVNDVPIPNATELLEYLKTASGKIMLEGIYENYPGEYYYAFPMQ